MNLTINGSSFSSIYKKLIDKVLNKPDYICCPRNQQIKECINVSLQLSNPYNNLYKNEVRSPDMRYLAGELAFYLSRSNRLEDIQKYSKFWTHISNNDGTVNSAYGYNIFKEQNIYEFTEAQWAYDCLKNDKDSRQAIIRFNKSHHSFDNNKDFPCTIFGQFLIRNNELIFIINMRSNDLKMGIVYDIPFFTVLQQMMYLSLKELYTDLKMGSYIHNVSSMHIYERDFKLFEEMLTKQFKSSALPKIKYNFSEDFEFNVPLDTQLSLSKDPLLKWIKKNK